MLNKKDKGKNKDNSQLELKKNRLTRKIPGGEDDSSDSSSSKKSDRRNI